MNFKFTTTVFLIAIGLQVVSTDAATDTCISSLSPVYQGNCISDWAVIASAGVQLAWCKNDAKFIGMTISSQDMICNCETCHTVKGNGCLGGSVEKALDYLIANKGMGGDYNGADITKKDYQPLNGPTNYIDCLQYWSTICDPNEDNNCSVTPYEVGKAGVCLAADETTKCNRTHQSWLRMPRPLDFSNPTPRRTTTLT